MTTPNHPTAQTPTAWQRYLASEHAARDAYLATTHHAHQEYLTGPWPDRDAYNAVEVSAWMTYYAAGRAAWQTYRAETTAPPPPPARSNEYHLAESVTGAMWPASPYDHPQPTFNPITPPVTLNEFDQRQETYLAADPNRRDQL